MKPVSIGRAWGLHRIDPQQKATIAMIGTGVDSEHPAFEDKDFVDGVSFTDSPWNVDTHGQGTHLAGIVLGRAYTAELPPGRAEPIEIKVPDVPKASAFPLAEAYRGYNLAKSPIG